VLVVAPHPDDDAIGCGGTLVRLAASGARISVTYVTDGSASHRNSRRFPPLILRDVREREARAALRELGVRARPQFLRAPDSGLTDLDAAQRERLVAALARRIVALRAQVIFSPWPRDPHADHVATATLLRAACDESGRRPAVYFYGVWLPVRGAADDEPQPGEATVCDIALRPGDLERKRAAILEHRSQTGALIDDDPDGFRIDESMLATWLRPFERFYRAATP
jgi:LmbE family N-acetylglucosaminyl deacetylase